MYCILYWMRDIFETTPSGIKQLLVEGSRRNTSMHCWCQIWVLLIPVSKKRWNFQYRTQTLELMCYYKSISNTKSGVSNTLYLLNGMLFYPYSIQVSSSKVFFSPSFDSLLFLIIISILMYCSVSKRKKIHILWYWFCICDIPCLCFRCRVSGFSYQFYSTWWKCELEHS